MPDQDVWTWLRSCLDCGEVHKFRPPTRHDHGHYTCYCNGSWAHPKDGHAYCRRLPSVNVDALQREYESAR